MQSDLKGFNWFFLGYNAFFFLILPFSVEFSESSDESCVPFRVKGIVKMSILGQL